MAEIHPAFQLETFLRLFFFTLLDVQLHMTGNWKVLESINYCFLGLHWDEKMKSRWAWAPVPNCCSFSTRSLCASYTHPLACALPHSLCFIFLFPVVPLLLFLLFLDCQSRGSAGLWSHVLTERITSPSPVLKPHFHLRYPSSVPLCPRWLFRTVNMDCWGLLDLLFHLGFRGQMCLFFFFSSLSFCDGSLPYFTDPNQMVRFPVIPVSTATGRQTTRRH